MKKTIQNIVRCHDFYMIDCDVHYEVTLKHSIFKWNANKDINRLYSIIDGIIRHNVAVSNIDDKKLKTYIHVTIENITYQMGMRVVDFKMEIK